MRTSSPSTPRASRRTRYWFNDNNQDVGWDAVWQVSVSRSETGWQARFRIPLSQLRFSDSASSFGFAVVRQVARLNETDTWPLLAKSAQGYVSSFGEVTGLRLGGSHKKLEITPYVVSQLDTQPPDPGNPFVSHASVGKTLGADLKYASRRASRSRRRSIPTSARSRRTRRS